jgi:hypothetical protein
MIKRGWNKGRKKGLSNVIAMLLFVLLAIVAISIVAMLVMHKIEDDKEKIKIQHILLLENTRITKTKGDFANGGEIDITLKRVSSDADKEKIESTQKGSKEKPLDVVLVLDRSGSMYQSGWILTTSVPPVSTGTLTTSGYDDEHGDDTRKWSSHYLFNVPAGTQVLVVGLDWSSVPGYPGSEASEFALNLGRPDGTYIVTLATDPYQLGHKVDPPNTTVGRANEYYSGISTRPQYYYITNPQSGGWNASVYPINLRPKDNRPPSQDVSISVYLGDSSSLQKSETVLTWNLTQFESRNFVDRLDGDDRAGFVVFGTYGLLVQPLTSDKTTLKNSIGYYMTIPEGGTNMSTGIIKATDHLIANGRADALKVIALLTDGQDDYRPEISLSAAQRAKNNGITIFTIGLTNFVNENVLKNIASKPEYYYYNNFNKLDEIFREISEVLQTNQEIRTVGISFIIIFKNDKESCQKEIDSSELPQIGSINTFNFNLEGCIKGITKIEIYPKMKNQIGPLMSSINVVP